jgi:hypothetical protein
MRRTSSLSFRNAKCINFERFSSDGNVEVRICIILDPVLFPMFLDGKDVIIVIPTDLVYQAVGIRSNDLIQGVIS